MKKLLTRTLTGIVFVLITIGCLLLSQFSYMLLFLAVITVGMYEFFQFFNKTSISPSRFPAVFIAISIFILTQLVAIGYLNFNFFFLLIPLFSILFLVELFRLSKNPLENIATSILSILYIALPTSLTALLVFPKPGLYTPNILIGLFLIIWIYDSCAYLFGITLGKHRLLERVSPKKSWEGAIGGAVSALVASYFLAQFAPEIGKMHWMIITILVVIFSTFGDLTESLFKRQFELKDSSNILPGHGGILDRFDSLFFAAPVAVFYIKFIL